MENPKISVIVPVYDAEKYLHRCVDSILAQTFKDFELLLIDDGSKDRSGEICDEYARKDERVRVWHKENGGISATREFGLQQAKGIYIQFVDSDDWIAENMLQIMFEEAERKKYDIVNCSFTEIFQCTNVTHRFSYRNKNEFLQDVVASNWGVLWKLLINKKLILGNDIHFPKNINNGEDYYFVVSCLLKAKNVGFIEECLYFYNRCNSQSTISTPSYDKAMQQINATKLVEKLLRKYACYKYYKTALNYRKIVAKEPLWKLSKLKWFAIFPNVSYISLKVFFGYIKRMLLS